MHRAVRNSTGIWSNSVGDNSTAAGIPVEMLLNDQQVGTGNRPKTSGWTSYGDWLARRTELVRQSQFDFRRRRHGCRSDHWLTRAKLRQGG